MTEKNSRIKFVRINWLHQLGNYFRYPYSRQISGLGFQILDILILAKYQDQGFKFQISLSSPNIMIRVSNFRYSYPSQISGLGFQILDILTLAKYQDQGFKFYISLSQPNIRIRVSNFTYPYPRQISGLWFQILDILIQAKYQDQGFKLDILILAKYQNQGFKLDILTLAKYQDQGFIFQISLSSPNIRIRVSNFRYPYPSLISGLGFQIWIRKHLTALFLELLK